MAIKFSKKPGYKYEPTIEEKLKSQQAEIKKLKEEKIELELSLAELYEQSQADKTELQLAIVELAEGILAQENA